MDAVRNRVLSYYNVLVLISLALMFFRIDGVIVDSMLAFKNKAIAQFIAGLVGIVISISLAQELGIVGIAIGVLLGQLGLDAYLFMVISSHTDSSLNDYIRRMSRPISICVVCIMLSYLNRSPLAWVGNWQLFALSVFILGSLTFMLFFVVGISPDVRSKLIERIQAMSRIWP